MLPQHGVVLQQELGSTSSYFPVLKFRNRSELRHAVSPSEPQIGPMPRCASTYSGVSWA